MQGAKIGGIVNTNKVRLEPDSIKIQNNVGTSQHLVMFIWDCDQGRKILVGVWS